jgi:hypothetical protein
MTGITTIAAGERAEFLRLARWFLVLCCRGSPSAPTPGACSPYAALAEAGHAEWLDRRFSWSSRMVLGLLGEV